MSIKSLFLSNKNFSFKTSLVSLFVIVLLRVFLETFSNPSPDRTFLTSDFIFLHVPIFYFSVFSSLLIILYLLTKDTFENLFAFLVKAHLLILIAPIVDLLINGSKVNSIGYVILQKGDFLKQFFHFMIPTGNVGVTVGVHIASYLLFISMGIFIYKKTKKITRSLLGIAISYTFFFINAVLPSIAILPQTLQEKTFMLPSQLYNLILQQSWITKTSAYAISDQAQQASFTHNIFIANLFWIFLVIQVAILLYIFNKEKLEILKKTLRPTRVFNFILLAVVGLAIGGKMNNGLDIFNLVNLTALIAFIFLIILNSILAVFINDAEDIPIDTISNPDRPLVQHSISLDEWKKMRNLLLILIVFGTFSLNTASAFFLILTQGIYYLYSAHPFKFKRHFLSASVSMGLATVFVALSGFYLAFSSETIFSFPIKALLIIGLSQALLSNMKDIKDFAGDSHENIRTLPVVFGIKNSKIIIAILYAIVFISVPLILNLYSMLPFAFFCSLFVFYLFTKTIYQEKPVFYSLFAYMAVLFIYLV